MGNMQQLLEYLGSIPPGPVTDGDSLESLLASAWEEFAGASDGGMQGDKLYGRMEAISWEPPILIFKLERHGGKVQGSTRAEIQCWEVNTATRIATCAICGHRQLTPMQPRLDVRPLAEQVSHLIIESRPDSRLTWRLDGSVRVLVGEILPDGLAMKDTLQGRRKSFRTELERQLEPHGWRRVAANVYSRRTS